MLKSSKEDVKMSAGTEIRVVPCESDSLVPVGVTVCVLKILNIMSLWLPRSLLLTTPASLLILVSGAAPGKHSQDFVSNSK